MSNKLKETMKRYLQKQSHISCVTEVKRIRFENKLQGLIEACSSLSNVAKLALPRWREVAAQKI